jgi:succinate dehydrogenase/fumarate reductase flavoprotein subunit
MKNEFLEFIGVVAFSSCVVFGIVAGLTAANYFISAEPTVKAINAQCGTQYKKLDYLRIGQTTMLQICETRQKRIEIR